MTVCIRFLFFLTGLTGVSCITTVSKVTVKAGGSIKIPCSYHLAYINHVKYLCKGRYWHFCSYAVKTNPPAHSGKFLISDDKIKNIFTVTINDLMQKDTGYYWCAVEIKDGADLSQEFHLSVTRGVSGLYVDHQEVNGFIGDSVNIKFHTNNNEQIKMCRLNGNCVTGSSGSIDGTTVSIDKKDQGVFIVTMSGLKSESSGWYVFDRGDLQMPIHLNVTEKPATTSVSTTCETTSSFSTEAVNVTVVGNKNEITFHNEQDIDSLYLSHFIIPLILLIITVTAALLIWFIFKKHKQKNEAAEPSTAEIKSEEEVTYSSVVIIRKQNMTANEDNVIYSSLA